MATRGRSRQGGLGSWLGSLRRVIARRTELAVGATSTPPTRQRPRLRQHADGRPRCVACSLCASACPADCIHLDAGHPEHLDSSDRMLSVERQPARFEVDLGRCLLCGLCVSACPEEAIGFDPSPTPVVARRRDDLRLSRDALLSP